MITCRKRLPSSYWRVAVSFSGIIAENYTATGEYHKAGDRRPRQVTQVPARAEAAR